MVSRVGSGSLDDVAKAVRANGDVVVERSLQHKGAHWNYEAYRATPMPPILSALYGVGWGDGPEFANACAEA